MASPSPSAVAGASTAVGGSAAAGALADTTARATPAHAPAVAVGAVAGEEPHEEITLDRYVADIFEVKNIGSGSFGCAIMVEARSNAERFVAKKITFEHLTPDEQVKAQNEASLLKSFRHVNITEYLGSFVINNVLHIIMEYCSGGSLQQAMARRERANETFDEEEVFDWFLQVSARSEACSLAIDSPSCSPPGRSRSFSELLGHVLTTRHQQLCSSIDAAHSRRLLLASH